jgi:uncharacterized surface protein with fasciclin (FAS1) repeats
MANVLPELIGRGPYTVFVPTNEAFKILPTITFNALFNDTEKLRQLVYYHIVQGEYKASELIPGTSLETLQGEEIKIVLSDYEILINEAKFVQADIPGENGIGQIIDTVLFPPSESISPTISLPGPSMSTP